MKVQHYSPSSSNQHSNTNSPNSTSSRKAKNVDENYALELENFLEENTINFIEHYEVALLNVNSNELQEKKYDSHKKTENNTVKVAKTYTEIKKLIEEKDLEAIKKLSQDELSSRDITTAETLLHVAANEGYLEVIKLLCDNGCSLDDYDNAHYLPIHYAAAENKPEIVEWFLEQSKEKLINNKGEYNYTPLHMAAENDAIDVMIGLIKHGANLQSKDQGSRTPLDILLNNHEEYLSYFMNYNWNNTDISPLIGILTEIGNTL